MVNVMPRRPRQQRGPQKSISEMFEDAVSQNDDKFFIIPKNLRHIWEIEKSKFGLDLEDETEDVSSLETTLSEVAINISPEDAISARITRSQKRSHQVSEASGSGALPNLNTDNNISSALSHSISKRTRSSQITRDPNSMTSGVSVASPKSIPVPSTSQNALSSPTQAPVTDPKRRCLRSSKNIMNKYDDSADSEDLEDSEKALPLEPQRDSLEVIKEIISKLPSYHPRGHIIPTGLKRVPFYLELQLNNHIKAIVAKLGLMDNPKQKPTKPTEIIKRATRKYQQKVVWSQERNDERFYIDEVTGWQQAYALIGPDHQIQVEDEPSKVLPADENDRDEVMWSAAEIETHFGEDEEKLNHFYGTVEEQYLFSIWRQFESHIQPEIALRHLHLNQFDIPKSLDTIDQCLIELPQKMKPPCVAQVQLVNKHKDDEYISMRRLQEMGMRNYHLGELITFKWNLGRYFSEEGEMTPIGCNCLEPKCRPLTFEPRYGCANCMKGRKEIDASKLCLICQTYQLLTGEVRSNKNVVLDDEEKKKLELWMDKEEEEESVLSREQFEELVKAETKKRQRRLFLTHEEILMLNYNLLGSRNLGEQVVSQLKPYILPHIPQCQCQKSGNIPRLSPNYEKLVFTAEEAELFGKTLVANRGSISISARKLGVETELVERFLMTGCKKNNEVWKKYGQLNGYSKFRPRVILPPINAPKDIPDMY